MTAPNRVLVTGAAGFVGGYVEAAIAARWPGASVFGLAQNASDAGANHVIADLLDQERLDAIIADSKPDVVIHLAAQSSTTASTAASAATWAVNVSGTLNLGTAVATHAPGATILFASSSEVYGASFLAGPANEATSLVPLTPYAKSKAAAERLLADVLPPETRLIVARPFNHTGAGQRATFVLPSFAGQIARMESGSQPLLLKVGNLDVAREILDVRDVVEAYLTLVETAPRLPLRFTCNIATGDARPLRERVELLREMANVEFEIEVDPTRLRLVDVPIASGDPSLLQAVTGWVPRFSCKSTLGGLLERARADERDRGRD